LKKNKHKKYKKFWNNHSEGHVKGQQTGKPCNFKVFGFTKTKGPNQNIQNREKSRMPEKGESLSCPNTDCWADDTTNPPARVSTQ
jgi:hypothetical protein